MNRVDALFGDAAMGYTAPVAKGAALGYPEQQRGGFTDLLGARQKMDGMSLEEKRYLQMGGGENVPPTWAPMKRAPTQQRVVGLPYIDKMMLPQNLTDQFKTGVIEKALPAGNSERINWTEAPRGAPKTPPRKGLGPNFGEVGQRPGEQKNPPPLQRTQGGGARRSRKARRAGHKSRKAQRGGRRRTTKQERKSFLNLRVTGQIRMKQRHRQ